MSEVFKISIMDKSNTTVSETNEALLKRLNKKRLTEIMEHDMDFRRKLYEIFKKMQ